MIRKVDHIGIAVDNLEKRLPFWAEALGLQVGAIETVESERVKVAFLSVGDARIELLEATDPESTIARHVGKRGPGIHHLTLEVADLDGALAALRGAGVEIIGDGARDGAGGHRVAFVHPKSSGGVLLELSEGPADTADEEQVAPGSAILLYLREPQEKMWGVLRRLDATGVAIEGLDLGSFDDWLAQLDPSGDDVMTGPSVVFVPMARVEKILLDRPSGALESLTQRAERRAGCSLAELIRRG
ncbi:MAG: methylmalonyl-CoA epimerase [Acidobacteria bacterium]|nr:methylmalonyl-CoA epimerase [Acidobacteriota bacterium]NIM63133.1 methylmalonyl-CoA epimerase [Acidobacteriota bacterium]NIO58400.1 methylmalonyl-CoA epimerase [Acidobacteriota bacterium]NIQ29447.1 methylmalonyl-CoA epimerase [Acidobacteriota bacterium]NIQ84099.1 methylmalonyl-CoA epimerase [Acidobacteriota bacterium]